jgi:putative addiction module component (TIGR02574 family)
MDLSATLDEIASLSLDDRIYLLEALWANIAAEPGGLDLTEAQKQELGRRLIAHRQSPETAIPWEEIKDQALARVQQ